MASPNAYRGMTRLLSRDRLHQGIKVDRSDDALKVDLYIIVEYGLNVAEVAGNVRSQVAYQVEKTVGRPITELHIHVQGGTGWRERMMLLSPSSWRGRPCVRPTARLKLAGRRSMTSTYTRCRMVTLEPI